MKRRTIAISAVSSLLVATAAYAATHLQAGASSADPASNRETAANPPVQAARPKTHPAVVKTLVVEPTSVTEQVSANGTTAPVRSVTFSAEIPGKIEALRTDLGRPVRKGQVLALIDHEALAAERDRAAAAFKLARITYERLTALGDDVVTRQRVDEAASAFETARAGLSIAEDNVNKGVIRSNLTGVVTAKYKEKSEYAAPGAPIFEVVDYRTIVVEAELPETEVVKVHSGDATAVWIEALGQSFDGKVKTIVPVADADGKTFTVRVEIDNPKLAILVGMSATLTIHVGDATPVFLLPQDTVIEAPEGRSVLVVRDGIAVKQPVQLGDVVRDRVVITNGLQAGDEIITLGQRRVEAGQAIERMM